MFDNMIEKSKVITDDEIYKLLRGPYYLAKVDLVDEIRTVTGLSARSFYEKLLDMNLRIRDNVNKRLAAGQTHVLPELFHQTSLKSLMTIINSKMLMPGPAVGGGGLYFCNIPHSHYGECGIAVNSRKVDRLEKKSAGCREVNRFFYTTYMYVYLDFTVDIITSDNAYITMQTLEALHNDSASADNHYDILTLSLFDAEDFKVFTLIPA